MNKKTVAAILILLMLAFLVAFHQFYRWQIWFEMSDIHHETFVVALVCLALGIALSEELK
jgi:hypothetical protein